MRAADGVGADTCSTDLDDCKDDTRSSSLAMRASAAAAASILSCCCVFIATVRACNFSINMSSRDDEEGVAILGDEEVRGGNCSGDKSAGRTGSVVRERRLYGPPDIMDLKINQ